MKIGIANDHRGKELKFKIIDYLNNKNIEYINYGTDTEDSVDYVDYALKLCNGINNHEVDLGILICGTGIGMSIAANKIKGIRAARCVTKDDAYHTRVDNDANILCLSYNNELDTLLDIINTFISTPFSNLERHVRRVNKITKLESGE